MPLRFQVTLKVGPFVGGVTDWMKTEPWLFACFRLTYDLLTAVLKYLATLEAGS